MTPIAPALDLAGIREVAAGLRARIALCMDGLAAYDHPALAKRLPDDLVAANDEVRYLVSIYEDAADQCDAILGKLANDPPAQIHFWTRLALKLPRIVEVETAVMARAKECQDRFLKILGAPAGSC